LFNSLRDCASFVVRFAGMHRSPTVSRVAALRRSTQLAQSAGERRLASKKVYARQSSGIAAIDRA